MDADISDWKQAGEEILIPVNISEAKSWAMRSMHQMWGFCTEMQAMVLAHLILEYQLQRVVEIGVWGGKSLIPMACAVASLKEGMVYGIDPWSNEESTFEMEEGSSKNFWGSVNHEAYLQHLMGKIEEFGLDEFVTIIRETSAKAPIIKEIDLLHIDGNHNEITSFIDVIKWVPHVKSGGWVVFDDIGWYEKGKCMSQRATDWLDKHCEKIAEYQDECVFGVWRKR
jgi:predicted O-methyltransferase YrrM